MKKVLVVLVMLVGLGAQAQLRFEVGASAFNQDPRTPITWAEIQELKANNQVVPDDRLDGTGMSLNLGLGYDLGLFKYDNRHFTGDAGFSGSLIADVQLNQNNNYNNIGLAASGGVYVDFGLRLEYGKMYMLETKSFVDYFDIGANIYENVYIYTRINKGNMFTNNIEGKFALDNSPLTLDTASFGIRIKL